jgi:uncharacterized protein YbjT (DUF2867 family)
MTVLVTGATGNIGSKVARELYEKGVSVRGFVRDDAKAREMLGGGIELAVGDFSDAESLRKALHGIDRVLLSCSNQPQQAELEIGVIDAAAAAGVRRIVKLSSIGARVGAPLSFWDWHGRSEQHLRRSVIPAVILQSNFYMSNVLAAANQVRELGKLLAPAEGAKIAMVDPRDVAAVAAVLLTSDDHERQTYELSGPEAITYEQVADDISAATARRVEFVAVPDEGAHRGLLEAGMPNWYADELVALFKLLRQGDADHTTDTVRAVTGREPRSFAQFARDHASVFGT